MRHLGIIVVLVGWVACGNHTFINIVDVSAVRGSDDRVTVTATVECEAVGYFDCAAAKEYCVTAMWRRPTQSNVGGGGGAGGGGGGAGGGGEGGGIGWLAGEAVDYATACKRDVLAHKAKTELTMTSTKAIPKPSEIVLSILTASGGRNDLDITKDALPSP